MPYRPTAESDRAVTVYDHSTDEHALIEACRDIQRDDFDDAFAELYRRYRDRVYSIAFRMTGNAVDAMDVVQDSFRVLFLKIDSFRFDAKFSTWLFRIVVNCSIDMQRRESARSHGRTTSLGAIDAHQEPSDDTPDPADLASSSELGAHVHRALARLSPKLRAVLVLRYLEGMSYEQLAETLQIQLGTVKSRLARAHMALEGLLSGTLDAFGYPVIRGEVTQGAVMRDDGTSDEPVDGHDLNGDEPDADDDNAADRTAAGGSA